MSLSSEIVLTGGPCAGKTSALSYLRTKLSGLGYRVLTVPESATFYIQNGISDISHIATQYSDRFAEIQAVVVQTQLDWRRHYHYLAEKVFSDETCIILYDRGPMDTAAYVGCERFMAMMRDHGWTHAELRDSYDAVIHLVTAADGAPSHYTSANNSARYEDVPAAIRADRATMKAWAGHPHLRIIDNSTDFDGKMRRLLEQIVSVLKDPVKP